MIKDLVQSVAKQVIGENKRKNLEVKFNWLQDKGLMNKTFAICAFIGFAWSYWAYLIKFMY